MMLSKVTVTTPLNAAAAELHARRIAVAYVLAALGTTAAGLGGLIAAIRGL
ncbi:hypothetical protein [Comamonas thiooxydans]|uniref:hypothetical protein n=1 Tax=Comamonas thiooxydans TaxID=363952 RepID=UPI002113DFAE|nr:hypothetical protein [Comamonas thiooxydans]UUE95323.1 hypothetical protein MJ608_06695 [Comamonas thiooxydans]